MDVTPVYRLVLDRQVACALRARWKAAPPVDWVLLTSGGAAEALVAALGWAEASTLRVICLGGVTREAARRLGLCVWATAPAQRMRSLFQTLCRAQCDLDAVPAASVPRRRKDENPS